MSQNVLLVGEGLTLGRGVHNLRVWRVLYTDDSYIGSVKKKSEPMSNYVELGRRFRDLTDEEREDPSALAMMGDSEPFRGDSWGKVLQSGRVVILATAGSGKTKEMQAQVARLRADGKHAFFIPIEALDKEIVKNVLAQEAGDEERWKQWLGSDEDVWIFLDSVDELKLVNGKLEKALPKVAAALGAARDRAHIILSCRPTDWRPRARPRS